MMGSGLHLGSIPQAHSEGETAYNWETVKSLREEDGTLD